MRLGLLVGAFPADVGERYIHYYFNFCEVNIVKFVGLGLQKESCSKYKIIVK